MTDMETVLPTSGGTGSVAAAEAAEAGVAADVLVGAGGDPLALGLPVFLVGALVLGMTFVGVFPTGAAGVAVFTSGLFLLITALWGLLRGQTLLTGIFGTVGGLFISDGVLTMGLYHNWFLIPPADVPSAEAIFFIAFACWFTLLLVPSIMLPRLYTVTISIVVISLIVAIVGELHGSPTLLKVAGAGFLVVSFFIAWLFLNTNTAAAGMKAWPPLGAPVASSFMSTGPDTMHHTAH